MIKEMFKKNKGQEESFAEEPLLRDSNLESAEEENQTEADDPEASPEDAAPEEEPKIDEPVPESPSDFREAVEKAYCLGAGIDDETLAKAKKVIADLSLAANSDTFNPESLKLAIRLLNYEKDLEEARKEGWEAGKAEQISAAFRDKRRRADEAAAIPRLGGTRSAGISRESSIFDFARGVK